MFVCLGKEMAETFAVGLCGIAILDRWHFSGFMVRHVLPRK
jgi:hypothetical protein